MDQNNSRMMRRSLRFASASVPSRKYRQALGWAIESENDGTQSGAEPAEFVLVGVGQFVEYFEAVSR